MVDLKAEQAEMRAAMQPGEDGEPAVYRWNRYRAGREAADPGWKPVLDGMDLRGVDLTDPDYPRAGANLENASLKNIIADKTTNFSGANLSEAVIADSQISGMRLDRAYLEKSLVSGNVAHKISLAGAHMDEARLSGNQLQGANIQGLRLYRGSIDGNDFASADIGGLDIGHSFIGGNDFTHADTNGLAINIQQSRLHGNDFTGAAFTDNGRGAQPSTIGWSLIAADNVFSGANLQGLYFNGSDMEGLNLSEALLGGTGMNGANLTRVTFSKDQTQDLHGGTPGGDDMNPESRKMYNEQLAGIKAPQPLDSGPQETMKDSPAIAAAPRSPSFSP